MSIRSPDEFDSALLDRPGTVFLDDRSPGRADGTSYLLCQPREILTARTTAEVPEALARLDDNLRRGRFVAGFISYDAGLGLDKPLCSRHQSSCPLVWLGVYDQCRVYAAASVALGPPSSPSGVGTLRLNVTEEEYRSAVARVKEYLHAGDVYQINLTCRLRFEHEGAARGLFSRLHGAHPVCHSAWVNTGPFQIISLSPELFLRRQGLEVRTRPMKGTLRRGRWWEEDEALAQALPADAKNRAENVMIVDLMRNDLGRLCQPGTVQVTRPLQVERYRSLFQMTSEVVGQLRPDTSSAQLLRATFPPGSVTGAPKLRAIEIIDELEREARGVYCGTIGLFQPGGDCLLNVAIRTIVQQGPQCELGVGGGIVADSDPSAEWAEMWLKGRFLFAQNRSFELLETMLVQPGSQPVFLEAHLERMRQSASYFGWDFPEHRLRDLVSHAAAVTTANQRFRLLLGQNGHCRIETSPLVSSSCKPVRALLAVRRVDPGDVFLYHKTTAREAYDGDWRAAQDQGYFDLVYRNLNDEITEGAISNLVAEIEGCWYTPPLACGLLPGIWRGKQLKSGQTRQRTLTLENLRQSTRIIMGNSVRGAVEIDALVNQENGCLLWQRKNF